MRDSNVVREIMCQMFFTKEGQRITTFMGLTYKGNVFFLDDHFEDGVSFNISDGLNRLTAEQIKQGKEAIAEGDIYTISCLFQDMIFGSCYIY